MKILQVVPFFTPKRGGSVAVPYEISKYLSMKKHKVTILTTDFEFDEGYAKSIEKIGVEVIPFHCITNIGLFLFSPGMKRWLKDNIGKFDIVHMHNFRSYQNNVVYRFAKNFDVPYILQAHGSIPYNGQKPRLKSFYDFVWGTKILKDAARVIALNKTESQQYKKMGIDEDKIEIVPNGIDLSEYETLPRKGEFKKKYGIKSNEKIILFLGRIQTTKGIDLLISAFANLVKKIDNARLVIAGPDENGYQKTLEKMVKNLGIDNKVLFTGFINMHDKKPAFVDADLFVNVCKDEIFGLVFLEAIACGTPVICSKGCGIANVIDNRIGLSVEYDRYKLKDAIISVLSDERRRQNYIKNGKELINQRYNWGKITDQYLSICNNIID